MVKLEIILAGLLLTTGIGGIGCTPSHISPKPADSGSAELPIDFSNALNKIESDIKIGGTLVHRVEIYEGNNLQERTDTYVDGFATSVTEVFDSNGRIIREQTSKTFDGEENVYETRYLRDSKGNTIQHTGLSEMNNQGKFQYIDVTLFSPPLFPEDSSNQESRILKYLTGNLDNDGTIVNGRIHLKRVVVEHEGETVLIPSGGSDTIIDGRLEVGTDGKYFNNPANFYTTGVRLSQEINFDVAKVE